MEHSLPTDRSSHEQTQSKVGRKEKADNQNPIKKQDFWNFQHDLWRSLSKKPDELFLNTAFEHCDFNKPIKKNVTFIRQTHPKNSSICAFSTAFGPHKVFSQELLVLADEQVFTNTVLRKDQKTRLLFLKWSNHEATPYPRYLEFLPSSLNRKSILCLTLAATIATIIREIIDNKKPNIMPPLSEPTTS